MQLTLLIIGRSPHHLQNVFIHASMIHTFLSVMAKLLCEKRVNRGRSIAFCGLRTYNR